MLAKKRSRKAASATRFVHTNLVAHDWKKLSRFYIKVFGCTRKPPERDLEGAWLDEATSLSGAHIRGIHLGLPGYGAGGPTLEIFQYSREDKGRMPAINRPGFGHIAFAVRDVGRALQKLERHGGGRLGRRVSTEIEGAGRIDFIYARDPEGNIIELQRWA
jgi:lactoylglutathione lyase